MIYPISIIVLVALAYSLGHLTARHSERRHQRRLGHTLADHIAKTTNTTKSKS